MNNFDFAKMGHPTLGSSPHVTLRFGLFSFPFFVANKNNVQKLLQFITLKKGNVAFGSVSGQFFPVFIA